MSCELIGIGDLHLDKMAKIFPDTHHILVMKEFQKAANYARANGITDIIQYGDVCETPYMSRESRKSLYRFIKENSDLTIWVILGNHDWGQEGVHSLDELELLVDCGFITNVRVITKPTVVEFGGVPVHFMPYPAKKVKKNHVNIAHVDINGFKCDSGNRLIESDNVFPDDTLLLTGHLHTPQHKDPWYCAGTLYQTNFGESKEKGWQHIKVKKAKSGQLVWEINHIQNTPEFTLENLIIETRADLKKIKASDKILYKLFIKQDIELPEDLLTRFPNILKLVGFSSKKELLQVMENFLTIENSESETVNPTEYLGEFMRGKGATDKQVDRAMDLISLKGFV